MMRSGDLPVAGVLAIALVAFACSPETRSIVPGRDTCARCTMGIAEPRFAAELVTRTRQVRTFDSIECMAGHVAFDIEAADVRSIWVTDHDRPARLIRAGAAFFLKSPAIRSPMGLGLAAFMTPDARDAALARLGGSALDWAGVLAAVRDAWPDGSPHLALHSRNSNGHLAPLSPEGWLAEAVSRALPGDRVRVPQGVWRESTIVIDKPLELIGEPGAVLDGEGERPILVVRADDVTIRNLTLRNTGSSHVDDRAAIRFENANGCRIEDNRIEGAFFGVYLASVKACTVRGNTITGEAVRESSSGNAIHAWYSSDVVIEDNEIRGHRDGIYFEFVHDSRVSGNSSARNLRYGLHFMFSNRNRYERNVFRDNGSGVAVMYAADVDIIGNEFRENWGPATFGLLLKDIRDSRLDGNTFVRNSIALYAEGSDRLRVVNNEFRENGWAVKLMANSDDSRFLDNDFSGNTFDVATNSARTRSEFARNYWDGYRGLDLNRDGIGDTPYRPVRLFSLIVEQNEPSLILLRSLLVQVLDAAEAVLPSLTPAMLVDGTPRMRPVQAHRLAESGRSEP
ncbi:MAG: nitrous oxide reductase family maturation protein NosD [Gemmatimonadetes bacterium]|nr:nitrous oxide reductase family maturation protein NosD [Gemmatimonadota bacterium]